MIMREITEAEFEKEVVESQIPTLCLFSAQWCSPCKAMKPTIEKLAEEHPEIKVVKIDVDDAPNLCKEYAVMSIPKLILFRDGVDVKEHVGSASKDTLLKLIA
jgi:thioredoxin 1